MGSRPPPRGPSDRGPGGREAVRPDARTGDRPAAREPSPSVKDQADELVRTTGIPRNMAFQVVRGALSLREVLERMSTRDRVETLVARHGLIRSLATQVALGQIPLDEVLRKRRLDEHLAANRDRSALTEAVSSGKPVALAVHDLAILRGVITQVDPYEIEISVDGAPPRRLHKLQIKYLYDPASYATAKKAMGFDAAKKKAREPIALPQDRYGCSDRRLFRYLDDQTPIVVTTLEGNTLRGTVTWLSRWEFGMKLARGGAWCVVMRHALEDVAEER